MRIIPVHLAGKIGQAFSSAAGVILIAGGTVLALHGFTAQADWMGPVFGISDGGIGLAFSIAGLALIVSATTTRVRPVKRVRLHKKPASRKIPAKPPQSAQDAASDLEALIRWDEESRKSAGSLSDPLAEAYSGGKANPGGSPES